MPKILNLKSAFGALAAILLASAGLFLSAPAANAHAELASSNPIADSVIGMVPPTVDLVFGEPLMVVEGSEAANQITVTNADGKRIDNKTTTVADRVASATLDTAAGEGKYTVAYRVVSEDGHPIEGKFDFEVSVAAQSGETTPMPISELPEDEPTAVIAPAPDMSADTDAQDTSAAAVWPWFVAGGFVLAAAAAAVFAIRRRR